MYAFLLFLCVWLNKTLHVVLYQLKKLYLLVNKDTCEPKFLFTVLSGWRKFHWAYRPDEWFGMKDKWTFEVCYVFDLFLFYPLICWTGRNFEALHPGADLRILPCFSKYVNTCLGFCFTITLMQNSMKLFVILFTLKHKCFKTRKLLEERNAPQMPSIVYKRQILLSNTTCKLRHDKENHLLWKVISRDN